MKMRTAHIRALCGIAVALATCQQVAARDGDSVDAEIRALKERLEQLEKQIARQASKQMAGRARSARKTLAQPPEACKADPCQSVSAPPPVWVDFSNSPKFSSYDKAFSFQLGGRIFVDGGVASQPLTGQSGNVALRSGRLWSKGTAFSHWFYYLQYDFASSGGVRGIREAYFGYRNPSLGLQPFTSEPLIFMVGNMYEPMGLEQVTSQNYDDFIDHPLAISVFTPDYHIGAAALTHGDKWSAKFGVFSTSPEDTSITPSPAIAANPAIPGSVATGGQQYLDLTGRFTYAPILEQDALLHLGGSFRYQIVNSATGLTSPRTMILGSNTRSEANVLGINLLGTPDLSCGLVFGASAACTKDFVTYGAELAASYGPFSFQGEYFGSRYNRSAANLAYATRNGAGLDASGGTSLHFEGLYAYVTWYLTGESRAASYNIAGLNAAEFGRIKILNPVSAGGIGAWQLSARYSMVNLNDGGIQGGRQEDITLSLNWYPDRGLRLMANWIHVANISAPLTRPWVGGAHPNIFLMRTQVDW